LQRGKLPEEIFLFPVMKWLLGVLFLRIAKGDGLAKDGAGLVEWLSVML
jgi:hypothetical protein